MQEEFGKIIVTFGRRDGFAILAADGGVTSLILACGPHRAMEILQKQSGPRIMVWEGYVSIYDHDAKVEGTWRSAHRDEIKDFLDLPETAVPVKEPPNKLLPAKEVFFRPGMTPESIAKGAPLPSMEKVHVVTEGDE
jgi:hypothetical protein